MTLLSIVQNAADEIGVPRPAQVANNNDQTTRTMLAFLNSIGRSLARLKNTFGGGWTILEREHTFSTVASTEDYALPSDYEDMIGDTVWDQSNFWEAKGPLSPQEWQAIRSGLIVSPALRKRFRIKRGSNTSRRFFLDPIPSSVETVVFEYVSNAWVSDGVVVKTSFTDDADVGLLDEDLLCMGLVWRFKQSKGFDFSADLALYEVERDRQIAADPGKRTLFIARRKFNLPPANVPETGFGA